MIGLPLVAAKPHLHLVAPDKQRLRQCEVLLYFSDSPHTGVPSSSGAVNGQPLATVLGNNPLNRFRNIFFCQVLHKDDWFSKEIVSPFLFHAPKDVIWCRHRERELSPVIQYGVHIEIVILWIALCQVRKIINCHYSHSWSCHILFAKLRVCTNADFRAIASLLSQ